MKLLYNSRIGTGIIQFFSEEFEAEYMARTGQIPTVTAGALRAIRSDPIAIAIYEEKGSKWSSGSGCCLALFEIPDLFEKYWTIQPQEFSDSEELEVDVNEVYADILHIYMETGDAGALADGYRKVRAAAKRLPQQDYFHPSTSASASASADDEMTGIDLGLGSALEKSGYLKAIAESKAKTDVSSKCGYGFFDTETD